MAHTPRDPTPGAIRKGVHCPECGKVTTHQWVKYPDTPFLGQRYVWHWECTGLSAEERAASK